MKARRACHSLAYGVRSRMSSFSDIVRRFFGISAKPSVVLRSPFIQPTFVQAMKRLRERHILECEAAHGDEAAYLNLLKHDQNPQTIGDFYWPLVKLDELQPAGDPAKGDRMKDRTAIDFCATTGVSSAAAVLCNYALRFLPLIHAGHCDVDEGQRYRLASLRIRNDNSRPYHLVLELLSNRGGDALALEIGTAAATDGVGRVEIFEGGEGHDRKRRFAAHMLASHGRISDDILAIDEVVVESWMIHILNAAQHIRLQEALSAVGNEQSLDLWLQGRVFSHMNGVVVPAPVSRASG